MLPESEIEGGGFDPGPVVETDHELIFTAILLLSDDSFDKGGCHMRIKY